MPLEHTHTLTHTHTTGPTACHKSIRTPTHTHTQSTLVKSGHLALCVSVLYVTQDKQSAAHSVWLWAITEWWPIVQKPDRKNQTVWRSHTHYYFSMSGFSHQQPLDALITLYLTECTTLKRGAHLKRTQRIYCESPFCFCSQQRRLGATLKGFGSESFSHSKPKFAIPNSKAKI